MSYVVTFCSRNKDNQDIPNFKQRCKSFLFDGRLKDLHEPFQKFVKDGCPMEFSRLYVGINHVDETKVKKELAKFLIDEAIIPSSWNLNSVHAKMISLASLAKNKLTKQWLFDCDTDYETASNFMNEVIDLIASPVDIGLYETPHGYAVVVERGFDTREILSRYPDIELKRDGMLCYEWGTND